jgi:sulfatase modifying factor 1
VALGACMPKAHPKTAVPPAETREPIQPTVQATPTKVEPIPTQVEPTPTAVVVVGASGFEMVLVEPGDFQMGAGDGRSNEQPVHTVSITKPFYLSKCVVTFEQYDAFCDDTDKPKPDDTGWGRGDQPVNVTWYDAVEYCNWLSEIEGLTPCYNIKRVATECDLLANGYRLATEAEWEYAARGGPRSRGYAYAGSNDPGEVAWYEGNSGGRTYPVGQKAPNELGSYDMSGNLWEWCWDWYGRDFYASSPITDPTGPARGAGYMGQQRVRRGGSFQSLAEELRVARRGFDEPGYEEGGNAIRLVRTDV